MNKNNHNVDHEIVSLSDLQGSYYNNINPYNYHHVSLDSIISFNVVGPTAEQGTIWQLLFFLSGDLPLNNSSQIITL